MIQINSFRPKHFLFSALIFALLCFGNIAVFCQTAFVSTFNQSSGSNGKVSFTVGQSYTLKGTGSNGETINGIQQPYSIYTLGVDDAGFSLEISVFPNPVCDELILKTKDIELKNLSFTLYDLNGIPIETKGIMDSETLIQMDGLQAATYFLKVMNKDKSVKSFKVIKY